MALIDHNIAMKLSNKLHKLLNEQINNEISSSYTYLQLAAWFETTPYNGFAQWMFVQSQEEHLHALKFYRHLSDRDAEIELLPIAKPKHKFKSALDAFEISYDQEKKVTAQIAKLYEVAEEVRDHSSKNLLLWFLSEQIEEEKNVRDMIDRLKLAGNDPSSLLMLDREAAVRKPLNSATYGLEDKQ